MSFHGRNSNYRGFVDQPQCPSLEALTPIGLRLCPLLPRRPNPSRTREGNAGREDSLCNFGLRPFSLATRWPASSLRARRLACPSLHLYTCAGRKARRCPLESESLHFWEEIPACDQASVHPQRRRIQHFAPMELRFPSYKIIYSPFGPRFSLVLNFGEPQ